MISARNAVSLSILILLGGFHMACHPDDPPGPAAAPPSASSPSAAAAPAAPLPPAEPLVERDANGAPVARGPFGRHLEGDERHRYRLDLRAGEYLHLVAEQDYIDVGMRLTGPGLEGFPLVDSPTGRHGAEILHFVALADGVHEIEVEAYALPELEMTAAEGRYVLGVEAVRPATAADEARALGQRAFMAGLGVSDVNATKAVTAVEKFRHALETWRKDGEEIGDPVLTARALDHLGRNLVQLGEPDEALRALEEARRRFDALGDRQRVATVLNYEGNAHRRRLDVETALASFETALEIFREIDDPIGTWAATNNIGNVYQDTRELEKAALRYREARELALWANNRLKTVSNLGRVLVDLGQLPEAFDVLEEALELARQVRSPSSEMGIRRALARAHYRRGDARGAVEQLEKILGYEEGRLDSGRAGGRYVALTLLSLGDARMLEGKPAEASPHYRRALELFEASDDEQGVATALASLGRTLDCDAAQPLFNRARQIAATLDEAALDASVFYAEGETFERCGRLGEARESLRQALARVEEIRVGAHSRMLSSALFAWRQRYYDLLLDVLAALAAQSGRQENLTEDLVAEALKVAEARRARTLLDALGENRDQIQADADPQLLAEKRRLQKQLNLAAKERLGVSEEQREAMAARQRQLIAELRGVEARIRGTSQRWAALERPHPLGADAIQKELDEETALLIYSAGREQIHLFMISQRALRHVAIAERERLERMVGHLRREWGRGSSNGDQRTAAYARHLGESLLGPVVTELAADEPALRRLVIVGDGQLSLLPFAALPLPEERPPEESPRPLIERFEIARLPSASTLPLLRENRRRAAPTADALAFGDPVLRRDDPRLPALDGGEPAVPRTSEPGTVLRGLELERLAASGEEARAIFELAPEKSRLAVGLDAERELLLSGDASRYRYVHLGGHGLPHPEHPELSGLVFSRFTADGRPRNGILRVHEIYDLELGAEVVTLSACRSGLGPEIRGEGIVGLPQAFLYAGAARVVASLWNVADRPTADLMTRFYRAVIEGRQAPAAALREAQLATMEDEDPWRNVRDWAPFVIYGDWRP